MDISMNIYNNHTKKAAQHIKLIFFLPRTQLYFTYSSMFVYVDLYVICYIKGKGYF